MENDNTRDNEHRLKVLKDSMRLWRIQGVDPILLDEVDEIIKIAEHFRNQLISERIERIKNNVTGRYEIIDVDTKK